MTNKRRPFFSRFPFDALVLAAIVLVFYGFVLIELAKVIFS